MHKMLGGENGFEVKFCDKKNCPKFWWFKNNTYLCIAIAKIAQLVEHNLAKVGVAGSSPVFRSKRQMRQEQGVIKSGWRNW